MIKSYKDLLFIFCGLPIDLLSIVLTDERTRLTTPEAVEVYLSTASWDFVEHAETYSVYVDGQVIGDVTI